MSGSAELILIVEDEQIIAHNIKIILNNFGYSNVLIAACADKALSLVNSMPIKLMLIDINLGDNSIDGIDLAFKVRELAVIPHVFITANADRSTVSRAKETEPSGYIVKPFNKNTIFTTVELALFESIKNSFSYTDKTGKSSISINQVTHCVADGSYVSMKLANGKTLLIRDALKNIERQFPEVFVRVHRSTIVNVNHVMSYNQFKVLIKDNEFKVGSVYKKECVQRLSELINS